MSESSGAAGAAGAGGARASAARLAAVEKTGLVDSEAEEAFDILTRLAAVLLKVPASFISVVDRERDFYKSQVGFPPALAAARQLEGPTFCHLVLEAGDELAIDDTHARPSWREVPTVDSLGVRAYVGVPLRVDGELVGSFCVIDDKPRPWTADEREVLRQLATSAGRELALRAALRDAREAVREREVIVAALAHDLRTPLQVLDTSAAVLAHGATPAQAKVLARVTSATQLMARMVEGLMAEHAASPTPGPRAEMTAAALLDDVADTMTPIAARAGIGLSVGAVADATVEVDYPQILRVLCNLVGNAVKYSPADSAVAMSAARAGDVVRFEVADRGRGMTADELTHAFARGWQGAEGLARGDGAGLGLPIVKDLVERHGGHIELTSAPGVGTTATVTLPCR